MTCSCTRCRPCNPNILEVTSVSQDDSGVYLIPQSVPTFKNGCKYLLVIPCNLIPAFKSVLPVFVAFNNVNTPITDRCIGNNLMTDQLRFIPNSNCGNKVLRLVYGSNPTHFKIISQDLPQSVIVDN